MLVSVVIPIYNVERIVKESIIKLVEELHNQCFSYEILLCDDGSKDRSAELIEGLMSDCLTVHLMKHESNQGLGATLQTLFHKARGEIVIYSDCDLPFGLNVFKTLIEEIEDADIVLASRYKGIASHASAVRKITSRIYYYLCRALFSVFVSDIGSGAVAFRKKALERLNLKSRGFDIHVEIFAKARLKGLVIKEMPFVSSSTGINSFSIIRHGPATVIKTLRLWWKIKSGMISRKKT